MDNNFDDQMPEKGFDSDVNASEGLGQASQDMNVSSENSAEAAESKTESGQSYTDPNAGAVYENQARQDGGSYTYGASSQGAGTNQTQNGPQGYNYGGSQNHYGAPNGGYGNYQNPYQTGKGSDGMDHSPLSMGEWVLTLLAAMIPCAGLILYLIWAFGSSGNINRRNYCRAALIVQLVAFVLSMIFVIFVAVLGFGSLGAYYYY